MKELTLIWTELGQQKHYQIRSHQPSQQVIKVRIGRDPHRCDLVLSHPTVSGLHIEIFFDPNTEQFRLRNLRSTNPPMIDGQSLRSGEMTLNSQSQLILGQQQLTVEVTIHHWVTLPQTQLISPPVPADPTAKYGLRCPQCDRICSFDQLELSCQWCGTSLAAAESVVLSPDQSF